MLLMFFCFCFFVYRKYNIFLKPEIMHADIPKVYQKKHANIHSRNTVVVIEL